MAKKVSKSNKEVTNKKKDKKVEVLEEEIDMSEFDDEDFEDEVVELAVDEDYDDEDVVEETIKVKKAKKVSSKEQSDLDLNRVMSIATLVISALALIISLVILSKVSFIAKQYDDGKSESGKKVETELNQDGSYDAEYDTSTFTEISAKEFINFIKKEDSKVFVYTGRPTCSYCTMMIGNLIKSVEDYDYTLYYLDTDNLDEDTAEEITKLDEILESDFPATPMVYLVGDGKVYDVNEGYTNYETYTKFLEDNDVEKR